MADTKISNLSAITSLQTTDEFVVARAGTTKKVAYSVMGNPWELYLDLPLTSSTDWGMGTGWSNDGSKMIVGVNTPQIRNKYNVRLPQSGSIIQVEVQMPSSSRSAADQRAGIVYRWDGTNTGAALQWVGWQSKASAQIGTERDAVTAGPFFSISGSLALDAWHKFQIVNMGMANAIYINDTFIASTRIDGLSGSQFDWSYIALYGYQIDAWFRNLKVYRLKMP